MKLGARFYGRDVNYRDASKISRILSDLIITIEDEGAGGKRREGRGNKRGGAQRWMGIFNCKNTSLLQKPINYKSEIIKAVTRKLD